MGIDKHNDGTFTLGQLRKIRGLGLGPVPVAKSPPKKKLKKR
jgi:hypothetical protein